MNRAVYGLVIALTFVSSAAQARSATNAAMFLIEALRDQAVNGPTRKFGVIVRDAVANGARKGSFGKAEGIRGAQDLAHQGFIIMEAESKSQSALVVREVRKGSEQFRAFNWEVKNAAARNPETYISPGEIEIGLASQATPAEVKLILENEARHVNDFQKAELITSALKFDEQLNKEVFRTLWQDHGLSLDYINVGLTRIVKLSEKEYIIVRNLRVDANQVTVNAMADVLDRMADKLTFGYPNYSRYVNP